MKQKKTSIVRRFAILIFSVITVLGLLFILITYISITHFHEASMQLLNKDVAAHIAKFTSPFEGSDIDRKKADSIFYNAMVLSPASEVYFLDTKGKVIAFHADSVGIDEWNIPLLPVEKYINSKGEKYIKGTDPRDPSHAKIFSAAEVVTKKKKSGYIYVILDSKRSEGIMDLLFDSHILNIAITGFLAVIILSLFFSFLYLRRISKNYRQMIIVLDRFESGDYSARFNLKKDTELEPVTHAFNRMADLLSSSINKLTKSEQERKNFIATISHDLRTPLSIARGYTETLMFKKANNSITSTEQEQYSQMIHNKLLQIENMVKQLFELSKMDAIEFSPNKEPFVLSEIVQEAVNTFSLIASEKKIALKCTQCLYHVWIDADVSMIERVVQNLIENAVKSTPENGNINVWLSVDGHQLIFNIQNSGDPLPADLVQWINNSTDGGTLLTSQPAKLGLGLMIVQKILHLHNTSLMSSSENGFNTFTFALPVYDNTITQITKSV